MYTKYSRILLGIFLLLLFALAGVDANAQGVVKRKAPKPAVATPAPKSNSGKGYGKNSGKSSKGSDKSQQSAVTKKPEAELPVGANKGGAVLQKGGVIGGESATGKTIVFNTLTGSLESDQKFYRFVNVDGRSFKMGNKNEYQKARVDAFFIGECELPQWLWNAVMPDNPSSVKGDFLPVNNVNWEDCQKFIANLNRVLKHDIFYLPSEAQWEFAARGGTKSGNYKYSGSNNLWDYAWYLENSESPQDVYGKLSNELGIYGMTGNVLEWCYDWYSPFENDDHDKKVNYFGPESGIEKVARGGSFIHSSEDCAVTTRFKLDPTLRADFLGFRIAFTYNVED